MPTTPNQLVFSGEDRILLLSALSVYARTLLLLWAKDHKANQEFAYKILMQVIGAAAVFYPDQLEVWITNSFKNSLVTVYREDESTIQVTPFDYWCLAIKFKILDDEPAARREELGIT